MMMLATAKGRTKEGIDPIRVIVLPLTLSRTRSLPMIGPGSRVDLHGARHER